MEGQSVSYKKGFVEVCGKIRMDSHVVLLSVFQVRCNSGWCL